MGKFQNKFANRLSGLNDNSSGFTRKNGRIDNHIDESRLRFNSKPNRDQFKPDARHTLNQIIKSPKIIDARDLLRNKQQRRNLETDNSSLIKRTNSKKEPIVIVTGLGNVRHEGDSVRVLKRTESRGSHHVVSDGVNTFVTLTNDLIVNKAKNDYDILHGDTKSSSQTRTNNKNYEPIRIKITNSNYSTNNRESSSTVYSMANNVYEEPLKRTTNDQSFRITNENNFSRNNSSVDSMEYESSSFNDKVAFNRGTLGSSNTNFTGGSMYSNMLSNSYSNQNKVSNNGYFKATQEDYTPQSPPIITPINKDGYKLLVSNLHPRVTEDDVLELFSDIGPIKRARFIDKGLAEVVYVRIEHAKEAIQKYDQKELDGRQMVIGLADKSQLNEVKEKLKKSSSTLFMSTGSSQVISSSQTSSSGRSNYFENETVNIPQSTSKLTSAPKETLSNKFKILTGNKDSSSVQLPESKKHDINNKVAVDNSIIHQVLFNKKPTLNTSPVTFTVKL